jgi:hypothetical protein
VFRWCSGSLVHPRPVTLLVARAWRRSSALPLVLAGGVLAVAVRLPFLTAPLGADEGGYLLVASQWHPGGTSLYGNYWVDRPPLLILFFSLADDLGGAVGLRLLGCVAACSVVVLSHVLGRSLGERTRAPWPVVAATAFVCSPITRDVDGELIAVPLVLLGLVFAAWAREPGRSRRQRLTLWFAAGAVAAAGAMVKQNFLDAFVFGATLLAAEVCTRQTRLRDSAGSFLALLTSGALTLGAILGFAAARGTSPGALWDALIVFRFDAAASIAGSAADSTQDRFVRLVLLFCVSGALVLVGALLVHAVRRPVRPVAVATAGLVGWELFSILAGGGYWTHYLVGLIPGLVVTVGILHASPGRVRVIVRATSAYALTFTVIAAASTAIVRSSPTSADRVAVWLREHVQPGDTAVVMYGQPHILETAGLASPYPELWSLPVRVRDPELVQLTEVLQGKTPPTWVVAVNGLSTWGESARPHEVVNQRYRLFAEVCGVAIYRLDLPAQTPAQLTIACPSG